MLKNKRNVDKIQDKLNGASTITLDYKLVVKKQVS